MKFYNFPEGPSENYKNVSFINENMGEEFFFNIDGHLTANGHSFITRKLSKILKQPSN